MKHIVFSFILKVPLYLLIFILIICMLDCTGFIYNALFFLIFLFMNGFVSIVWFNNDLFYTKFNIIHRIKTNKIKQIIVNTFKNANIPGTEIIIIVKTKDKRAIKIHVGIIKFVKTTVKKIERFCLLNKIQFKHEDLKK